MAVREKRGEFLRTHQTITDGGPIEAASFIAGAVAELAQLSRRHKLDMLGYLLDMALLEANEIARTEQNAGKL